MIFCKIIPKLLEKMGEIVIQISHYWIQIRPFRGQRHFAPENFKVTLNTHVQSPPINKNANIFVKF